MLQFIRVLVGSSVLWPVFTSVIAHLELNHVTPPILVLHSRG